MRAHCPQGHPYVPANTYVWHGRRYCRRCRYERMRQVAGEEEAMKYRVINRRGGTWLRRAHCACQMRVKDQLFEPCFPHFGAGLIKSLGYLRRALAEYRRAR